MTDSNTDHREGQAQAKPHPDLKHLDRLIGTWSVSGGAQGQVTYAWMEGHFFLVQHVNLTQNKQQIKGIEIIGHTKPFGEAPSIDIQSRYYDSLGNTFDYVYELEGNTLTIWAGTKGAPAYYKGTLSDDGNTCIGTWTYPDGGGYASTMTKVRNI